MTSLYALVWPTACPDVLTCSYCRRERAARWVYRGAGYYPRYACDACFATRGFADRVVGVGEDD